MVTKWLGIVCINYSRGNFQGGYVGSIKTKSYGKRFPLHQYLSPIQVLNLHAVFVYFDGDIQIMLRKLVIGFKSLLGSSFNDRQPSRDKANIGNPKANKGCPLSTVNRTSAEYVQNSKRPPSRHIEMGHPDTGRFNAMSIFENYTTNSYKTKACHMLHFSLDFNI